MSFWDVKQPTTQMRQLCKSLGDQYRITIIDLERVINRDFGNGYDVEISNMNTTSLRKKARIYLWKDKKRIVDRVYDVPREDIGKVVDALYRKGADGLPEIVPEEAEIVRSIYRMFMAGKNPTAIAKILTQQKIPTPGGKENWQSATVESILRNEKYKGSALLQKRYTVDFLTKTMKVNEGEVPQYYVEDSHPAIIRPEEWEAVQAEIARRKGKGKRHDCGSPFSGKLLCGDCGSVYGSKVWHSNDKYRRVIWQCNSKFKNETKCATPHVDEKILKERFLRALSQYMANPEECIEGLRYVQKSMTDTDFIDTDIEKAERNLERLSAMVRSCIMLNASANLAEEAYTQQYTDLTRQYEEKKAEYEALLERKKAMESTAVVFSRILFRLTELEEVPIDFDEALWNTLVDHVTVYADERIVFSFMDGTEITEMV